MIKDKNKTTLTTLDFASQTHLLMSSFKCAIVIKTCIRKITHDFEDATSVRSYLIFLFSPVNV